jgi:hypothetical protein
MLDIAKVSPDATPQLLIELRTWAKKKRGRQAMMARTIGAPVQSVSAWVRGHNVPSWETGKKIEAFLAEQKENPTDKPTKKPRGKPGRPKKTPAPPKDS